MDRDELLECFLTVLNVCEPPHPHWDNPYPVAEDDVEYSYKRSDGPYWASCGPRHPETKYIVGYSIDKQYINTVSPERHLAILTHEVTHVTEGRHTSGGIHNKAFWREMAFNAWQVRENLSHVATTLGPLDEDTYVKEVITDPNDFMVDGRVETVEERQNEQAELLGWDGDTAVES